MWAVGITLSSAKTALKTIADLEGERIGRGFCREKKEARS